MMIRDISLSFSRLDIDVITASSNAVLIGMRERPACSVAMVTGYLYGNSFEISRHAGHAYACLHRS